MAPLSAFRLKSLGTRSFALVDAQGKALGELRSPGFFSQDMIGMLDGHALTLRATGFWRKIHEVDIDGRNVGDIRFHWRAIRITLHGHPSLELRKAAFSTRHTLVAPPDHPLLELRQSFNWRKLAPEYAVQVVGRGATEEQVHLLAMMCGCALRIRRAGAAAAAG